MAASQTFGIESGGGSNGGSRRRRAVVLFNLGGPDSPEAVRPFLFNLFNDPAIITAPTPIRWLLAQMISRRRAPIARAIYAELGGASPILPQTEAQAAALETALTRAAQAEAGDIRVWIAMRHWRPRAEQAAREIAAFAPDEVILAPLYPQYSTTTTGSSITEWRKAAAAAGVRAPVRALCCYPVLDGFVAAMTESIRAAMATLGDQPWRLLLTAHGLPKKTIAAGDPYQWQCEQTCAAIVSALNIPGLDWVGCYQSRVGPLEWIGPSTEEEIIRAGDDGVAVVVAPIAFVSEHSETLVELDIEYRKLASEKGVPGYARAETVQARAAFIDGLAQALLALPPARADGADHPFGPGARCPVAHGRCPRAA